MNRKGTSPRSTIKVTVAKNLINESVCSPTKCITLAIEKLSPYWLQWMRPKMARTGAGEA